MDILKQLLKEFWLPLIVAISWSLYNVIGHAGSVWSTTQFINVFGPTFFIVSWLTAQYFRVRKQSRVENDLQSIQAKVTTLLEDLENKTKDLVGHVTGGESYCYLMIGSLGPNADSGLVTVIHQGKHPLYDVSARIVDLEAFDKIKNNLTFENIRNMEIHRAYSNLIPNHCVSGEVWNLGGGNQRHFNIFWTTRNGGFIQLLRFRKIGNQWYYATRVERGKVLLEDIQEGYPRNEDGTITW